MLLKHLEKYMFYVAVAFVLYMPLHVFIVQSASLATGGLEVWKAAKDIVLVALMPAALYLAYRQDLWRNVLLRRLFGLSVLYALLHTLFLLFDQDDDLVTAIIASVYNVRLLGFLLLGVVVGAGKHVKRYTKIITTAIVLIATAVAIFGVAQYFLPKDLLEHVGYSVERGVKPLFFIDDKPEFPRVMSTLKDPNSFGAYLIVPILLTAGAMFFRGWNKTLFVREFRREALGVIVAVQITALCFTFSRGAVIALGLSTVTIIGIVTGKKALTYVRRYWFVLAMLLLTFGIFVASVWNTFTFQNIVFHADESTVLADPNEKRVMLVQDAIDDIAEQPIGEGPGTAGIVSIRNPNGTVLTENYYLQIAYEVGWFGLLLFMTIYVLLGAELYRRSRDHALAAVLFAAFLGYSFYSLLIHLWSNEALAAQWWLLSGLVLGLSAKSVASSK